MHTATIELPSRWQPDLFADQVALARFDVATTPEIESVSIRIGPALGSDHLPAIATLRLPRT